MHKTSQLHRETCKYTWIIVCVKQEEVGPRAAMMPDQVQYYFQLAQQTQANMQQQQGTQQASAGGATTAAAQPAQQAQPQQVQLQGNCFMLLVVATKVYLMVITQKFFKRSDTLSRLIEFCQVCHELIMFVMNYLSKSFNFNMKHCVFNL